MFSAVSTAFHSCCCGTSCTTQTALALPQWPPSQITHIGVHVPHIPAAVTVRRMRLFHSELRIVWLLFEDSVYLNRYGITIWGADSQILKSAWSQMPWPLQAFIDTYMWQSRVEFEGYSVAYFDCIVAFEAPYRWTSAKGGAHTCFVDAWISN